LRQGVLVGPVMAHPDYRGKEMPELGGMKVGNALIQYSLHHARRLGHSCAILKAANDKLMGYYNFLGFSAAPGLTLPGPNSAAESPLLMVKRLNPSVRLPVGLLIGTPQSADQLAQLEADRRAQLQPAPRRRSWTPVLVA
jgi:predicted N-acetyltransferase YhbS